MRKCTATFLIYNISARSYIKLIERGSLKIPSRRSNTIFRNPQSSILYSIAMTAAAKRFYYCYNRLKNKISAAGNISCLHYYRLEAIKLFC